MNTLLALVGSMARQGVQYECPHTPQVPFMIVLAPVTGAIAAQAVTASAAGNPIPSMVPLKALASSKPVFSPAYYVREMRALRLRCHAVYTGNKLDGYAMGRPKKDCTPEVRARFIALETYSSTHGNDCNVWKVAEYLDGLNRKAMGAGVVAVILGSTKARVMVFHAEQH